ncbi:hypothetical protein PINS_up004728 [Pythium insidiosum]|nr:hypothetical protein PINS_up004728 [Pythium insidiosum]
MHELQHTGGSLVFGPKAQPQVVLTPHLRSGDHQTVIIESINWLSSIYSHQITLDVICVPAAFKLVTLCDRSTLRGANAANVGEHIKVLPGLHDCWIGGEQSVPTSAPSLRVDEDYREYWRSVHAIELPHAFGGLVEVTFSTHLQLRYPAACVVTEWTLLYKQTREARVDIVRNFASRMKSVFGDGAITVSSSQDQPQTWTFLPASAMVMNASSTGSGHKIKRANHEEAQAIAQCKSSEGAAVKTGSLNTTHADSVFRVCLKSSVWIYLF